ncbi:unnamed protein product, partial [Dibothriocephalus latus]
QPTIVEARGDRKYGTFDITPIKSLYSYVTLSNSSSFSVSHLLFVKHGYSSFSFSVFNSFTHNEVERKRRARLKSETDFLHQQLPPANYRDKLAIFKAGTELLQHYANTNTSELRKLILTEEEYSACVLINFDGFAVRIRCRDGAILSVNGEIKEHLGEEFADCVGKTLYDYVVADKLAENVIRQNLSLATEDIEVLAAGQTLGRHFVLPLAGSSPDCYFVEFCGDIILPRQEGDRDASSALASDESILQALCKRLELCESASAYGVLFSMRLQPGTFNVLEISGR